MSKYRNIKTGGHDSKRQVVRINLEPMGKPRMTRADAWKKRKCVLEYWAFKNEINKQGEGFTLGTAYSALFCIPFPKSYSKRKCRDLFLKPHQEKPDLDNILKAVNDSFSKEDKDIYKIKAKKIWAYKPAIVLINH